MNIYLIERTDNAEYDEFDAFVVAAKSQKAALKLCDWKAIPSTPPKCKKIGVADPSVSIGVVLGSFIAG